jgi:hypothetical protein
MSIVIDFLERMGKDAKLRHAPRDELALALEKAHIEAPLLSAILAGDASKLRTLLNQRPLFVVQLPVEEQGDQKREDEDKDLPPQEIERKDSQSTLHVVAPLA